MDPLQVRGYVLLEQVYGTNTCSVFKARHPGCVNCTAEVAIKVQTFTSAAEFQRSSREIENQRQLQNHPNVVRLFEFFDEPQPNNTIRLYLVMEWVTKDLMKDIEQRRKNQYPWPEPELKSISSDLIRVLAIAQRLRICHRDIKPQNIFYDSYSKQVKLGDFGSSAAGILSGIQDMSLVGTPAFMSKELRDGMAVNMMRISHDVVKSDVYALGITLLALAKLEIPIKLIVSPSEEETMKEISEIRYSNEVKTMIWEMITLDVGQRLTFVQLEAKYAVLQTEQSEFRSIRPPLPERNLSVFEPQAKTVVIQNDLQVTGKVEGWSQFTMSQKPLQDQERSSDMYSAPPQPLPDQGQNSYMYSVPHQPLPDQGQSSYMYSVPYQPVQDQEQSSYMHSVPYQPVQDQGQSSYMHSVPYQPVQDQGQSSYMHSEPYQPLQGQNQSSIVYPDASQAEYSLKIYSQSSASQPMSEQPHQQETPFEELKQQFSVPRKFSPQIQLPPQLADIQYPQIVQPAPQMPYQQPQGLQLPLQNPQNPQLPLQYPNLYQMPQKSPENSLKWPSLPMDSKQPVYGHMEAGRSIPPPFSIPCQFNSPPAPTVPVRSNPPQQRCQQSLPNLSRPEQNYQERKALFLHQCPMCDLDVLMVHSSRAVRVWCYKCENVMFCGLEHFVDYIDQNNHGSIERSVGCPICFRPFDSSKIIAAFGGEKNMKKAFKERARKGIVCQTCKLNPAKYFFKCGHIHCKNCTKFIQQYSRGKCSVCNLESIEVEKIQEVTVFRSILEKIGWKKAFD